MEYSSYTEQLSFRDQKVPTSERTREQLIQDLDRVLAYLQSKEVMTISSAPIIDNEGNAILHSVNNGAVLARAIQDIFNQLQQEDSFRSQYNRMFDIGK